MNDNDIIAFVNERLKQISELEEFLSKKELSVQELCRYTGISKGHIDRLTSKKKIPYRLVNRVRVFDRDKIDEWLMSFEQKADTPKKGSE